MEFVDLGKSQVFECEKIQNKLISLNIKDKANTEFWKTRNQQVKFQNSRDFKLSEPVTVMLVVTCWKRNLYVGDFFSCWVLTLTFKDKRY